MKKTMTRSEFLEWLPADLVDLHQIRLKTVGMISLHNTAELAIMLPEEIRVEENETVVDIITDNWWLTLFKIVPVWNILIK